NGLLIEYEPEISPEVNQKIRKLAAALDQSGLPGVTEIVSVYRSLVVYFDPEQARTNELVLAIEEQARTITHGPGPAPRLFRVPTVYSSMHGPDLERVAKTVDMSPEQVAQLFSQQHYPVYCLGFLCCLMYLGGVPKPLRLPRLATPRTLLPAGSVGFAGAQACLLPIDQPSGFHYVGRTFVKLYDPSRFPPTPVSPGDLIECPAVSEDEARGWEGR